MPRKNIKMIAGKPMIAWTIEAAKAAKRLDRIIVSTDDIEIAQVAREWGAEVPFLRPADLARDTSSQFAVMIHCLEWLESSGSDPEYLFLLQPTSPLRTSRDIDGAVLLAHERNADAVVGLSLMDRHPCLAMRIHPDGSMESYSNTEPPYIRRQDVAEAYAINGAVYVNKCASLRRDRTLFPAGTLAFVMPAERAVDIDTPLNFLVAEQLLRRRLSD